MRSLDGPEMITDWFSVNIYKSNGTEEKYNTALPLVTIYMNTKKQIISYFKLVEFQISNS